MTRHSSTGRGVVTRTPERVAEAIRLHDVEGLTYLQIGRQFGIGLSTAAQWCTDPDGAAAAAKRRSYMGTCDLCGGPTTGDGPGRAAARCAGCSHWTPEGVLDALKDWFAEHGEPPRLANARNGGVLPHFDTVARFFGSWNGGLEAAGLPVICERRRDVWAEVRRRYLDGATVDELAHERGCTPQNIRQHLQRHGIYSASPTHRWSDGQILAAIRAWTREHGRPPSAEQWRLAGPDHPAYLTVAARFGWRTAIRRATTKAHA